MIRRSPEAEGRKAARQGEGINPYDQPINRAAWVRGYEKELERIGQQALQQGRGPGEDYRNDEE